MLYRLIKPLNEGDEVQYVGNYVLRPHDPPEVGFVPADEEMVELDELRQAARAVLDAYARGADLNTLNGVIQRELAPLVEHEEADDVS